MMAVSRSVDLAAIGLQLRLQTDAGLGFGDFENHRERQGATSAGTLRDFSSGPQSTGDLNLCDRAAVTALAVELDETTGERLALA